MSRCVPGPTNSCSMIWEVIKGKLTGHVRLDPQGGLKETCDPDCDDPTSLGLGICLVGDPDVEDPPDLTESGLRIDSDGCLWFKGSGARRQKTFSAATKGGVASTTVVLDESVRIDATGETSDQCWRVCIDVCSAYINAPEGGNASVSIPPLTVTPTTGVPLTIAHGSSTVSDPPNLAVVGEYTVGGETCEAFAANRNDYAAWSGTLCAEVTVVAGEVADIPVQFTADVRGAVTGGGFITSSGKVTVTLERVVCAEEC